MSQLVVIVKCSCTVKQSIHGYMSELTHWKAIDVNCIVIYEYTKLCMDIHGYIW